MQTYKNITVGNIRRMVSDLGNLKETLEIELRKRGGKILYSLIDEVDDTYYGLGSCLTDDSDCQCSWMRDNEKYPIPPNPPGFEEVYNHAKVLLGERKRPPIR